MINSGESGGPAAKDTLDWMDTSPAIEEVLMLPLLSIQTFPSVMGIGTDIFLSPPRTFRYIAAPSGALVSTIVQLVHLHNLV
jgi:hypothetical protein